MNDDAWVQTYLGERFDLLTPRPEQVNIVTIAHALSQQNRFGGHTAHPYSVAQHSLVCLELARLWNLSPSVQLQALMHDAAEAYIVDVPRPLKALLGEYKPIEAHIEHVIEHALHLPPREEVVKEIDEVVLIEEAHALLKGGPQGWGERTRPSVPLKMLTRRLHSVEAATLFLDAYHALQRTLKAGAQAV